jgi:hypothetical protein
MLPGAVWRKSSYSASNGGQCVEVTRSLPALVAVRDSTDPDGARLILPPAAWAAFVDRVKREAGATSTTCPSSTSSP